VPRHREVAVGTLRSVMRQAGLTLTNSNVCGRLRPAAPRPQEHRRSGQRLRQRPQPRGRPERGSVTVHRAGGQTRPRRQLRWSFCEPTKDCDSTEGKIAILGCVCGDPGCWPFRVRIALRDDVVVWSGFEQPHRSWRYEEMRPFVFDRAQYLSALSRTFSGA
jgi:hypothetical protein